ncbi:hypothetical protein KKH56_07350 [bacterium]|nr:hypothetical protein [bacterium]
MRLTPTGWKCELTIDEEDAFDSDFVFHNRSWPGTVCSKANHRRETDPHLEKDIAVLKEGQKAINQRIDGI